MITCVIPSRLGSSRFPGKPLKKILGRELVLRCCDIAARSAYVDDVIVATEDREILDVVINNGYELYSHQNMTHAHIESPKLHH